MTSCSRSGRVERPAVSSQLRMGNPDSVGIPLAQSLGQDRPVSRAWLWAVAVAVALAAFLFRLVPVLRGGGLFGFGNYDDGVYYASATGLVHGLLPYRDFLLLHPPAMPVLLAPFAAVAQLTSDSFGFAAARVAWMLLGAANAVLIWKILRPIGLVAAAFGGFGYAVFHPAVYSDKSTLLESPATTALLIAILLLQPLARADSLSHGRAIVAGALLGLTMTIKIWGVVTLLIVLGWLLLIRRYGVALRVLIASAAATTVICLPFFAAAPTAMWNQIVRDQLTRSVSAVTTLERLDRIVGLGIFESAIPVRHHDRCGRCVARLRSPGVELPRGPTSRTSDVGPRAVPAHHPDVVPAFRRLHRWSGCPHGGRGTGSLDRSGPRQTGTDCGRFGRRRCAARVRDWLGRGHFQSPAARSIPRAHGWQPGMHHVR